MSRETKIEQYFAGPLNLNRQIKQATTVMGVELKLNADEFDALDILAAREGEPLSFELLYSAVWESGEYFCEVETAKLKFEKVIMQVEEVGSGFMWIEYKPETGYAFKTLWGHNWKAQKHIKSESLSISCGECDVTAKKESTATTAKTKRLDNESQPTKNSKTTIKIYAACVAIIITSAGIFLATGDNTGLTDIGNIQVPMSELPMQEDVFMVPDFDKLTVTADASYVSIPLGNPEGNQFYVSFEITLQDTGETLYTSDLIEPGKHSHMASLTRPLPAGEYAALLTIKFYSPGKMNFVDEKAVAFNLVADISPKL
jgi:hypothetical protein